MDFFIYFLRLEDFWSCVFKGPRLYCFSSISYSCQRSNNTVFEMFCPKPIHGPEFQLSESGHYWEQVVSVPAPLMLMSSVCQCLPYLLHAPLRERMPLRLAVACALCLWWMYCYGSPRRCCSTEPVWPRRRGSWSSTDSGAAAGCFRMVSVSEYLTYFVHMCWYSYYHVANASSC